MEKCNSFDLIDGLCNECLEYLNMTEPNTSTKKIYYHSGIKYQDGAKREVCLDMNTKPDEDINIYQTININIPSENEDLDLQHNNQNLRDTSVTVESENKPDDEFKVKDKYDNLKDDEDQNDSYEEIRSSRLRKLSKQLPKIIITSSEGNKSDHKFAERNPPEKWVKVNVPKNKRRVTKDGAENVALISNIPFEKMRLLNDTFHTLINLRWRWIVLGTVLVHFGIWFIFAVFWYIAALAHNDFDKINPPKHRCITGGTDFLNIFLASVEAQTTIGFGDRTIDEECPESIFLFIMQLIMGTGLSGVLTCVVYAKLTRPENFAKDGVGFSKKAVVSLRDGRLCLMFRVWDLNYDHIIGSEVNVYFIKTFRTKEGEILKHYAQSLPLLQRQLMLWPVTVTHVIDSASPLYDMAPEDFMNSHYEITVSLKGASASMGTYTQSQTSYLPREILWGARFPSVVRYSTHEQKYVIDCKTLHTVNNIETPLCSARRLSCARAKTTSGSRSESRFSQDNSPSRPATPSSFTEQVELFTRSRTSSFRRNNESNA